MQFGLYTEESKGVSVDIGYSIKMKNGYSLGFVAKNFGIMTKLEDDSPSLPQKGLVREFQKTFNSKVLGTVPLVLLNGIQLFQVLRFI